LVSPCLKKRTSPWTLWTKAAGVADPFCEGHEAIVILCFGKKRLGLKSQIRQKNCSFADTSVSKTSVFIRSKRLKVFNTSLFLDTAVFPRILQKYIAPKRGLDVREKKKK
jgi:hypothetical protein